MKNHPDVYPDIIKNLPEVDMPLEGIQAWLMQSEKNQIVFFDIQPIGEVPPHSHKGQWGIVLEGEMDLTIGGETNTYTKGDYYYIPDGVVHSAVFKKRTRVIDFFDETERWKPKA